MEVTREDRTLVLPDPEIRTLEEYKALWGEQECVEILHQFEADQHKKLAFRLLAKGKKGNTLPDEQIKERVALWRPERDVIRLTSKLRALRRAKVEITDDICKSLGITQSEAAMLL